MRHVIWATRVLGLAVLGLIVAIGVFALCGPRLVGGQ